MYNIISSHPFGFTIEKDVLPTPRLISEGTRGQVEAYKETEYVRPHDGKVQSLWRVRDDSYDPPGTKYRWVRVEVVREKMPWDED